MTAEIASDLDVRIPEALSGGREYTPYKSPGGGREAISSSGLRMLFLAALLTSPWLLGPALATTTTTTATTTTTGSCPEGWVDAHVAEMGCLLFNTSRPYTWELANNYCNLEENASLVEILTPEQHEFVIMVLKFLADNGEPHSWWTSGTDMGKEGRWYWAQSLALVEEFVWWGSEPNVPTENCMLLVAGYGYMAGDYPCDTAWYPICQTK